MKPQLQLAWTGKDNQVVLDDVRRDGGNSALVGGNGEINANDNKELIHVIDKLVNMAQTQQASLATASQAQEQETAREAHKEMLLAAFDSKEELAALGRHLASEITRTIQRDGFMRRLLVKEDLDQGQIPRARMDKKEVVATTAVGPVRMAPSYVRADVYYPQEFDVIANPFIESKELARTPGDLLNETYVNALAAIMVVEDQTWKSGADGIMGYHNDTLNIAHNLLPINLAETAANIWDSGLSPQTCLFASDFWSDIISLEAWATLLQGEAQQEVITTGRIGQVYGMEMVSDFFRHPQHKVLERGELYIVGAPNTHGQYTDRNGVTALEQDASHVGTPGRGWHLSELISLIIVNDRSVAKLNRLGRAFGDNRQLRTNVPNRAEASGTFNALG